MEPAVYIPNFNGSAQLRSALRSLREQSAPVDVVVVDNGSSDGSVAMVREEFPEVTALELGRTWASARRSTAPSASARPTR